MERMNPLKKILGFSSPVVIIMCTLLTIQVTCKVKRDYSGSTCPLGFGLMTCLCAPKCDAGKIAVQCGDIITVTRWQTLVQYMYL